MNNTAGKPMLEVKNLSAFYGRIQALHEISLDVEEGEILTLIGANGAGKSSTLRALCGMIRSRKGEVVYQGRNISKESTENIVGMGISHVPEGRKIFPRLTVEENLDIGAYLVSDKAVVHERKAKAFTLFPLLEKRRTQKGGTLSGGEQQMLAIARALMQGPKLLMLDEPSMGLAPVLVEFIFEIIKELNARGTTVLLVEQNARMALQIARHACVLQNGRITLVGPAAEVAERPEVRAAYLGLA